MSLDIQSSIKLLKKRYIAFRYNIYNANERVRYYNFWKTQLPEDMWFTRFLQHHSLMLDTNQSINFYSVLGSPANIKKERKGIDILFLGENIKAERFDAHRCEIENRTFDLSLGFEPKIEDGYLRFPLWILYMFKPEFSYSDVKEKIVELNEIKYNNKTGFCALVSSHDMNGVRTQMFNSLKYIGDISSAGRFMNNTDALKTQFNDNKHKFITQFKFNICPENSNSSGYVTEKIFQSLAADCISIYWGADGCPEPDLINNNRLFVWDEKDDNSALIKEIEAINGNPELYEKFVTQPKFTKDAPDIVWNYMESLRKRFKELI